MASRADESPLIRLVRRWRLPLLLLLAGLVALDVRGAMGIAANLTYAACIGNPADPARRLEACTRIVEDRADSPDKRAIAYFKRAYAWAAKGDYDRAISDSDAAININPKYAVAYYNRGIFWSDKGDNRRAIADFGQAISFGFNGAGVYENRGVAWASEGNYVRAIADYSQAINLDATLFRVYENRGLSWLHKGDYDHAIADFTVAVSLDPSTAYAYFGRGLAWSFKGDGDRAIADYDSPWTSIRIWPMHITRWAAPGRTRATTTRPSSTTTRR
ncbi:hypothetical protein EH240_26225 [Mesorhizobium tamadayense]|uniref:Uncharacterized protein n=1 Tax=Mesorhizobium tamadayense TaxID=425306 RepID=A0A3P3F8P4_9HYPH|nr:hypothetical protein EH240_26225 [Mesorhizobium tamadayense]